MVMSSRRSYVARHRHGRPGLFEVAVLMATWPPLRPLRRRWFGRSTPSVVRLPAPIASVSTSAVVSPTAMPASGLLSHRPA